MPIPLAFDSELLDLANYRKYIEWDCEKYPHLAILGNTGSGKSYFIRLLLGYISKYTENAKAYVCCYKNELLKTNAPRFFGYKKVAEGFAQFRTEFEDRLRGNPCRDFRLLLIDEYVSWLSSMENKEADKIKKQVAECLFMVRSLNMHVILGAQRAMAVDFAYGSRDCLNVIFLGSPSKESIRSFCSAEDSELMKPQDRGRGYTVFDGQKPVGITVPTVTNPQALESAIDKLIR
jgi:energy-coupling factor transporter ATP-binding protein EcfA2